MKKLVSALLSLTLVFGIALSLPGCSKTTDEGELGTVQENSEIYDVTFLLCWNGGAINIPDDVANNDVLNKLTEKTGVRLSIESIATNETEKLNTMFASGTLPDLVNAAYWWSGAGEVLAMRNGIEEGLILDLTDLLEDYSNVNRLLDVGLSSSYKEFDLELPEYNGKKYFIPTGTPSDNIDDIENSLYGVYARKDMLEELNIDPSSIKNEEDIYQLATKIRDGNFKDATGNSVIPIGTWHSGWQYSEILKPMENGYFLSSYRQTEAGGVVHWAFDEVEREKIKYMRKLIEEDLFDVEAFSQSDTTAQEKYAIGKVGIFGARAQTQQLSSTLYKTNPEMEYTLLGPLENRAGDMCTTIQQNGASGSPILFLNGSMEEEKARAILGMLDYVNGDEGRMLMKYGIEGQHYTMIGGYPTFTEEVQKNINEDTNALKNYGLDLYGRMIGALDYSSKYPVPENLKTSVEKLEDTFKEKMPTYIIDKVSVGPFERNYDGMSEYYDKISTLDIEAEMRLAYFADTETEAMEIWDGVLRKLEEAGVDGMCQAVQEGIKNYPNPDELSF